MKLLISIACIIASLAVFSQEGGGSVYGVLDLSPTARVASSGGFNVSAKHNDPALSYFNPSLLDSTCVNNASLSWGMLYSSVSDVGFGFGSYSNRRGNYTYAVNLMMLNYGVIRTRDENGQGTGVDLAADYVVGLSVSEPINNYLSWGFAVKPVFSNLLNSSSVGLAGDVGINIHDSASFTLLSLVVRNLGLQIKPYTSGEKQRLPLDIALGYSKRFQHAPLRLSLTYRHAQQLDVDYRAEEKKSLLTDDSVKKKTQFATITGNALAHFVIGAELLLSKFFYLSAGYNVRMHNEMKGADKAGNAGFSIGGGISIAKIQMSYGHQFQTMAGGTNTFTISTNVDRIFRAFTRKAPPVTPQPLMQ